jgi:hypothetical protein
LRGTDAKTAIGHLVIISTLIIKSHLAKVAILLSRMALLYVQHVIYRREIRIEFKTSKVASGGD